MGARRRPNGDDEVAEPEILSCCALCDGRVKLGEPVLALQMMAAKSRMVQAPIHLDCLVEELAELVGTEVDDKDLDELLERVGDSLGD